MTKVFQKRPGYYTECCLVSTKSTRATTIELLVILDNGYETWIYGNDYYVNCPKCFFVSFCFSNEGMQQSKPRAPPLNWRVNYDTRKRENEEPFPVPAPAFIKPLQNLSHWFLVHHFGRLKTQLENTEKLVSIRNSQSEGFVRRGTENGLQSQTRSLHMTQHVTWP